MSFSLNHYKDDNYIHIHVFGEFSAEQYDQIMDQVVMDSTISNEVNTLWDLREMDFSNVKKDFLKNIIDHRKKYHSKRGKKTKAGIVAQTDLGFGVSRQYEALSFEFNQQMKIFRSVDAALSWFNESE